MITLKYSNLRNKCSEDKLDRQKHIVPLTNLLTNIKDESFVMTVSAPYGGGKTFFIKMWQKHLQEHNCKTLYYNAWENDFAINPLISFVSSFKELEAYFETSETLKEQVKKFFKSGKLIFLKNLPKIAIMTFGKILSKKTGIEAESLENIFKLACDLADEEAINSNKKNKQCLNMIEYEHGQKDIIKNFKESLNSLISNITKESNFNYPTDKLIIFIDDLDRCRPDYTIKFLEYIKHIFDVKNCIFVLAVDEEQLKSAIDVVYGSKNANGFLTRIIDFKFQLPEPTVSNLIDFYIKELKWHDDNNETDSIFYINKRVQIYESISSAELRKEIFVRSINTLATILKLSARDIEHIFQDLNIIFKSMKREDCAPLYIAILYIIENYYNVVNTQNEVKPIDKLELLRQNILNLDYCKQKESKMITCGLLVSKPSEYNFASSFNDILQVLSISTIPNDRHFNTEAYFSMSETNLHEKGNPLDFKNTIKQQISDVFCEKKLENLQQ